MKRTGIATRLAIYILGAVFLIMGMVIGYSYQASSRSIVEMARRENAQMAQATAERIGAVFSNAARVTATMALSQEDIKINEPQILHMSRRILAANPEIFGMAVAFDPYAFDRSIELYAPYTCRRDNGTIESTILGSREYQYPYMDWFQLARELDRPIWTEPYFDGGNGGNRLMITYATPFARKTRDGLRKLGVVTADIDISWLRELVSGIRVFDTGYVFLLSRYGTYIVHPDRELVSNETIFSYAEYLGMDQLRHLGKRMVAGESGFEELKDLPGVGACDVAFVPLSGQSWSLGVVLPRNEMLAGLNRLTTTIVGISVAGFLFLAGLIVIVSKSITHPLRSLRMHTRAIANGDFSHALPPVVTLDEVGELTQSFDLMRTALTDHIARLTATTAAKERIEAELHIASDIQMGILPKIFPAFPDRPEIDVFATIIPAREVGGDLYDFFFIDENRFCFLVGDVSGKGVPAAFFMAVTKTLIKAVAERDDEPGRILARVNNDLAHDNPSCMFVTLFLAIMDVRTGMVRYANAGHNPPVLLGTDGRTEWLESLEEPMAGAMPDIEFSSVHRQLQHGETIVMYTDGVTEAMNASGALYGENRLLGELGSRTGQSVSSLVQGVSASVDAFVEGAEQSDDITMLAIRFMKDRS